MVLQYIADKTRKVRYGLIYILSPYAYHHLPIPDADKTGALPRPMIRFVKKVKGNTPLVGVEIGVAFGANAKNILEILNIKRLYLIDPYESYTADNIVVKKFINSKEEAMKQLEPFHSKLQWVIMKSDDAISQIPDDLDFVYIDGNHDYNCIKNDIENYYQKVKVGGIIGGHDFDNDNLGVLRAVLNFAGDNNLRLHIQVSDWWIEK